MRKELADRRDNLRSKINEMIAECEEGKSHPVEDLKEVTFGVIDLATELLMDHFGVDLPEDWWDDEEE